MFTQFQPKNFIIVAILDIKVFNLQQTTIFKQEEEWSPDSHVIRILKTMIIFEVQIKYLPVDANTKG